MKHPTTAVLSTLLSLLVVLPGTSSAGRGPLSCTRDEECSAAVHELSRCQPITDNTFTNPYANHDTSLMYCTNPFAEGCFRVLDPEWKEEEEGGGKKRVCNSEDTEDTLASGKCSTPTFDYMEMRLFTHNWASVHYENWLLQIILSEFLDVPTSLECLAGNQMNFYHPFRAYDDGSNRDTEALKAASEYGDCLSLPYKNRAPTANDQEYIPCAHMATEIWGVPSAWELAQRDIIEAPQGLGVLGEEGWFVPKHTGKKDPSLLSYLGLQGDGSRFKLAEMFKRPTTWSDYCELVSETKCSEADNVALRAPVDEWESGRYFMEDGSFIGHFRATDENDCDRFPQNCTGHITDYPCGWSSNVEQQAHYLDIAVRSSGTSSKAQGYEYDSMVEIWKAANQTKSDVIMYWWTPDSLVDLYEGTEFEFTRITLPKPTKQCVENRVEIDARCHGSQEQRWGDPRGFCDDPSNPLQKVISKGLFKETHDPSIPEALRSPAYEFAQLFTLNTLQLNDIFAKQKEYSDPRESVCRWAVENKVWIQGLIPPGYPRQIEDTSQSKNLNYVAITMGTVASVLVLVTACASYWYRHRQIMKAAQIEFLALLLFGLFLVAVGSIMVAVPAVTGSCIAVIWLVMLGYTIELVPLLVKIAAINHLMSAARGHRRVVLRRRRLFTTVAVISGLVVMFLILWSALDPPKALNSYIFDTTTNSNEDGSITLERTTYCDSWNQVWEFLAIGFHGIMLVAGSVLAFQSRNIKMEDFNESTTVGLIVYSQSIFLVMRLVIHTEMNVNISKATLAACEGIIIASDVLVTTTIYFFPKLCVRPPRRRQTGSYLDFISTSVLERITPSRKFREVDFVSDIESNGTATQVEPHSRELPEQSWQSSPKISRPCPNCGHEYSSVASTENIEDSLRVDPNGATNAAKLPALMEFPSSQSSEVTSPRNSSIHESIPSEEPIGTETSAPPQERRQVDSTVKTEENCDTLGSKESTETISRGEQSTDQMSSE